jgi:hypothetical protein
MKIIKVENNDFDAAFDQLIECRKVGEFAVLEIEGTVVNTTDDVPDDFDKMSREDIDQELIKAANVRRLKMEAAKFGLYGDNLDELSGAIAKHNYEQEEHHPTL